MPRVALHTLGCKLNFAETSTIGRQFVSRGFDVVNLDEAVDVVVLNTCSVTERADRDARQWLRRVSRKSPNALVIVTGCYAQLEPEEIASIDGVDFVLGSKEKFEMFQYVNDLKKSGYPQVYVSDIDTDSGFGQAFSADVGSRTRAFLKIQDGCDYTCAFCTIPLARGESRSIPIDSVVDQANEIVARGYKEIVLTGVNVGDYGRKIGTNALELMKSLERVVGLERIRVSSVEPNLMTEEMVDFMVGSPVFCNHFHIPLQSGSDTVLKRMRRRYLTDDYRRIVKYIRMKDPDAGIGADVIVGFPGESEVEFEETYRFLADLPVSYFHVFTYSERPGTPAKTLDGAVEPSIRARRSRMLRILGRKKRRGFFLQFVDRVLPVLFESSKNGEEISGLTSNYIRVVAPLGASFENRIVPVQIREAGDEECNGVVVYSEEASLVGSSEDNKGLVIV
jgi:threonylcarbamoyladenosine tRNA methylthiotransferase MtaB